MMKLLIILMGLTFTQESNWNTNKKGIAIDGYDVVSYFSGEAAKGSAEFSLVYEGSTFHFISKKNLELFQTYPEKYAPQYGGFCAYAMAYAGDKVKVDPKTFKITDGKLYLFYNANGNNTFMPWNEDEPTYLKKADQNWQSKYLND